MPLLIGGATTSRVHTAVKIAPQLRTGRWSTCPTRRARSAWCSEPAVRRAARRVRRRGRAPTTRRSARSTRARSGPPLVTLAAARANAFKTDWARYAPPVPTFIGRRVLQQRRPRRARRLHRLGPVLPDLGAVRAVPGDPRRPGRRRSGAQRCSPKARRCSSASSTGAGSPRTASSASGPRRAATTTSRSTPTSRARRRCSTWHNLRQQNERPRGQAESLPRRLRRAEGLGRRATTSARSPSPPASASTRRVRGVRGATRRLQRDHAEGARRPPRRGVRRAAARARAPRALGLRARRERSTTRR